jgi:hypothetical protein
VHECGGEASQIPITRHFQGKYQQNDRRRGFGAWERRLGVAERHCDQQDLENLGSRGIQRIASGTAISPLRKFDIELNAITICDQAKTCYNLTPIMILQIAAYADEIALAMDTMDIMDQPG